MLRPLTLLACLLAATAAHAATVSVSSTSVMRGDAQQLVTVDFSILATPDPGFSEFISNLAMHVVAQDDAGNVLPVVPFGDEFNGGIFDSANVTTHENPTAEGILFVADFIGYPWNVRVGTTPLANTTTLFPVEPLHLATVSFLVDADTPLGTYTVTPAALGQLSAVVTSGYQPGRGTVWYSVPMFHTDGKIVVHTAEPPTWLLAMAGLVMGLFKLRRKDGAACGSK